MRKPPRMADWILSHMLEKADREFIAGDLKEVYIDMSCLHGRFQANSWYWGQILRSIRPFMFNLFLWRFVMLKNYFKLALRLMKRHLGFSLINVFGLAIGMACCILIFLWVQDELSYDKFHTNSDNLYQITISSERGSWTSSPWAMVPVLKRDFPEIEKATWYGEFPVLLKYGENTFFEDAAVVGEDFLEMFTFPFILGDSKKAFVDKNSVVMTRSTAEKYFGNSNPIGESVLSENSIELTVTGVIEDVPGNSHMNFDLLISPVPFVGEERMLTWSMDVGAYVLLAAQSDPNIVRDKISGTIVKYDRRTNHDFTPGLFPLRKVHLYSLSGADPVIYVYVFSLIALIVLLIACINFMNLTTARSSIRVNEIGIRRVLGGVRKDLIKQFLGESIGLACFAMLVAVLLVYLFLPSFNQLAEKQLQMDWAQNPLLIFGLLLFALLTGTVAGTYPAVHFSSFQPQRILRRTHRSGSAKNNLRRFLIISQFTASILLIIATATIYKQIRYIQTSDLGFNKDQILVIRARQQVRPKYKLAKERLLQNTDILHMTAASSIPLRIGNNNPVYWEGRGPDNYYSMNFVCVDYDYFETFDMKMTYGRSFSREFPTDQENYIINEAALKLTGYEDPVGKMYSMWQDEGTIVGVVKDFHGTSLHNNIRPIVFVMYQNLPYSYWYVKIRGENIQKTTEFVRTTVSSLVPGYPIEITFLDEHFHNQYLREERLGQILKYFTFLAIFVSCLGLFGLAAFMASRRSKEIAIRKVCGASNWKVIGILSREFVILIGLANLFAWPLGFFVMNRWTENFAYRAGVSVWVFVLSALLSLFVALLTVSSQSIKTAVSNPVDSLRDE
ncbi:ABC transporter permease [Acidobacteriota bacterium]